MSLRRIRHPRASKYKQESLNSVSKPKTVKSFTFDQDPLKWYFKQFIPKTVFKVLPVIDLRQSKAQKLLNNLQKITKKALLKIAYF